MSGKIVVIARSLPFHSLGGMEIVCWDLCKELALKGYNVTVLTTAFSDESKTKIVGHEGINIIPLTGTIPGKYSRSWWKLSAEALKKMSNEKIDSVISISAAGVSCLKYKSMFSDTKFIMQAHGTSFDEIASKFKTRTLKKILSSVKNIIWFFKDAYYYKKFDHVVAIGDSVERSTLSFPTKCIIKKNKVVKIENGIDNNLFSSEYQLRDEYLKKVGINDESVIILSASRLNSQKGIDNNLNVFAHFLKKNKNAYYLICGDGEQLKELQNLAHELNISQNVLFLGAKTRDELASIMKQANIFLFLTKRIEGLPLNILEAMSSGVPVITSNHLLFTESERLKKYSPNDVELISDAISGLVVLSKNENRKSYINEKNKLSYSVDRYCDLISCGNVGARHSR